MALHHRQLGSWGSCGSLEKVIRSLDPAESLWLWSSRQNRLDLVARTKLIVVTTDKKLGAGAKGEKSVGVVATFRVDGQAETDQAFHPHIAATGSKSNMRAERKTGKQDRSLQIVLHPTQCRADVVLLAMAVVKLSFAESHSAKVESYNRQAKP